MKAPTLEQYKKERVRILEREFLVRLSSDDKDKIMSAKSEIEVDNISKRIVRES